MRVSNLANPAALYTGLEMTGPKGGQQGGVYIARIVYTQLAVGGHPIEGSVEAPAKWKSGRSSRSESNGTERLGGSPVVARIALEGQM
jgi:hypothetical protein